MSNRTYQCERCFQWFDRYCTPEILYDGCESFCPGCFFSEIYDARNVFRKDGLMLTIETATVLEEPEEITDEEFMDVITVVI